MSASSKACILRKWKSSASNLFRIVESIIKPTFDEGNILARKKAKKKKNLRQQISCVCDVGLLMQKS